MNAVPVTNEQVATLRAQLTGDNQRYEQGFRKLETSADRAGYAALVGAAFIIATEQRFQPPVTVADLIRYVADVRARTASTAENVDPRLAEHLLHAALADEPFTGSPEAIGANQIVLLAALIADAQPAPDRLDALLTEARTVADQWVAAAERESS